MYLNICKVYTVQNVNVINSYYASYFMRNCESLEKTEEVFIIKNGMLDIHLVKTNY